jgi:hypothetical protein
LRARHYQQEKPAAMDNLVNIQFLVDDAKCFDTVRRLHWPDGVLYAVRD